MQDDGLVHNHTWASSGTHRTQVRPGYFDSAARVLAARGSRTHRVDVADDRDDGLVHSHDWAVSGK